MNTKYILVVPQELGEEVIDEYKKVLDGVVKGQESGIILAGGSFSTVMSYSRDQILSVELPYKILSEYATEEDKAILCRIKTALAESKTQPWTILTLPLHFLSNETFSIKGV